MNNNATEPSKVIFFFKTYNTFLQMSISKAYSKSGMQIPSIVVE
jgi:hypothetical protein